MRESKGLNSQLTILMSEADRMALERIAQKNVPELTLGAVVRWALDEFIRKWEKKENQK